MQLAPHPFTLRQLQYVVAVADALSFRRAAERCHVSQPSLSAQLAQMERALGARLFERDRRRVLATPAGRELVERARQVLVLSDDLVEVAKRAGDPLAGTLRIGVIPTISPYLLPSVTPALRDAFPALAPLWIEDKTSVLAARLADGELDAVLLALEADIGDVEHELVARDPFVLVTATSHALGARKSPAKMSELRNESVLLLDDGHCFRDQALALCTGADAHELEFRATSLSTLSQMVAGGAGVTLLPELAVPTETARAALSIRQLARPAPHRTIVLAWRKGSPLAPALRRVAAAIRTAYPHLQRAHVRAPIKGTGRPSTRPAEARRSASSGTGGSPRPRPRPSDRRRS